MLEKLDAMYRVAKGKSKTTWQELESGHVFVYEGNIYVVIDNDSDNPSNKWLLEVCEESRIVNIADEVDELLSNKDINKLSSRVVQRSLNPYENVETTEDNFNLYVDKLKKLIGR